MDISSLLAPPDPTVADGTPPSRGGAGVSGGGQRTHSSSHTPTSAPTPSVATVELAPLANGTPPIRQNPITSVGMDTLAELASMQQAARTSATSLRSAELIDPRQLPAMGFQSMQACPHNTKRKCTPCSSLDITMADAPSSEQAHPRAFAAVCVSEGDQQMIDELIAYLKSNLYAYESYVQLINLLHQGLISHIHQLASTTHDSAPSSFELLGQLRQTRDLM